MNAVQQEFRDGLSDDHLMILQTIGRRAGNTGYVELPSVASTIEHVADLRRAGLVAGKVPHSFFVRLTKAGRSHLKAMETQT
jgi:hypothetical protein